MLGARNRRRTAALCRQSEAQLTSLGLPGIFTIAQLCQRVEHRRARKIELIPRELPALAPHGLWVAGENADYVFYDCSVGPVRQHQIIAHEFGHMLFDDNATEADTAELIAMLAPDLSQRTVRNLQQRTGYTRLAERRAEMFGTVVVQRTQTWSSLSRSRPVDAGQLARLIETLEGGVPRP
jgi:hypothetical protein